MAKVADNVHSSHRAGCANDVDLILRTDFRRGRDVAHRLCRVRTSRSNNTNRAIVDPPDLGHNRPAELASTLNDVEEAPRRDFREQLSDRVSVSTEVNHIVEARVGKARNFGGGLPGDLARFAITVEQTGELLRIDFGFAHNEHLAVGLQLLPLLLYVGVFHTRPRLAQRQRRGR